MESPSSIWYWNGIYKLSKNIFLFHVLLGLLICVKGIVILYIIVLNNNNNNNWKLEENAMGKLNVNLKMKGFNIDFFIDKDLLEKASTISHKKIDRVTIVSSIVVFIETLYKQKNEKAIVFDGDFGLAFVLQINIEGFNIIFEVEDVIPGNNIYLGKGFKDITADKIFDFI